MKIITIIGARPQFIKAAVVSRAIKEKGGITEILVHTGQHFDANMSDVFFSEMEIPLPAFHLNINSMGHGKMTGRMLEGLEELMVKEKPDAVLVYGDTNSTLAGALAASKLHIPVAHVEAGLRSFNMKMPEEINRILTDRVSTWLFCPTETAMKNLANEGFGNFNIKAFNTGDVMYDAALFYKKRLDQVTLRKGPLPEEFILATLHREENTQNETRLKEIISTLNTIHKEIFPVVMPLHPGTAKRIQSLGLKIEFNNIEPVGYFDMIDMITRCKFVMTDSGGLQKEAFFFNKYCLTMRDETEWVELIAHKVNILVGVDRNKTLSSIAALDPDNFPSGLKLYGDGNAAQKILRELLR